MAEALIKLSDKTHFPLLPLRDVVVFPQMVIPLFVGRTESIKALEDAMDTDKQVFLTAQKDPNVDTPAQKDLYGIGTIATILQMLRLPDGTVKVLVEGIARAKLLSIKKVKDFYMSEVEVIEDTGDKNNPELQALMRSMFSRFEQLVKINKKIPSELVSSLERIEDPSRLADSIAAHMTIKLEDRQRALMEFDINKRLELLHELLTKELDLVEVEKRLQGRVKKQVEKSQRQYYLSEKIKAIQQELGELDDGGAPLDEIEQLKERMAKSGMPEEAMAKAESELTKLKMMPPMSAEATVSRNYLEALLDVPWVERSKLSHEMDRSEEILDEDHYGLEEVKERILEYLAVQKRVEKIKGPILCLVGPPGVGKTSLGQSIANATGREFARISLGGVRDEAEIRGHRRTYIGAMPGKIIQKLSKVKVRNPLFMLDEVDKMSADFRGDPASALLEVLDPEQNDTFSDHYLEVDYDLSDVMFIATSNSMNIPPALLDRMEIIRIPGYTEIEKLNIAKKYLIRKQMKAAGIKEGELEISDDAMKEIIRCYTREAGVRGLERAIAKLCRKVVRELVSKEAKFEAKAKTKTKAKSKTKAKAKAKKSAVVPPTKITLEQLEKYLGVKKYRFGLAEEKDQVGQVTGLAWTEVGGELLTIEAQVLPGKGKSLYTGSLGDVMQESIHTAMTVVRSRAEIFGIEEGYFQTHDFHVHVPEGATPKDGPSAGVGMCTSLVSAISKIPVRADVAMTGEITLRGEVLPIGGLKEKLLAALRGGIKTVIIPEENERDLKEIPVEILSGLKIHPAKWIDQVLSIALTSLPDPLGSKKVKEFAVQSATKRKAASKRKRAH
jgi:ATP-dependent Lon protease